MPKDMNGHTPFSKRVRSSGFQPYSSHGKGISQSSSPKDLEDSPMPEWEDVTCPICMEYPHNAVLLLCSSYEKGCRPYICDTSYRHSNCLDQYKKAQPSCKANSARSFELFVGSSTATDPDLRSLGSLDGSDLGMDLADQASFQDGTDRPQERDINSAAVVRGVPIGGVDARHILNREANDIVVREISPAASGRSHRSSLGGEVTAAEGLQCPLCRGKVKGWKVIQAARMFLNCKVRCCSQEGCLCSGTYEELRKHARSDHPLARPSDVDPNRQLAWRRLERQHDIGDVLSSIQSAMPGALVFGDFFIDGEDGNLVDTEDDNEPFPGTGNLWSAFLLFHVLSPLAIEVGRPTASRRVSRRHLSGGIFAMPPFLWGENLVDVSGRSREGQSSDGVTDGGVGPRRRRRTGRHRTSGGNLP